MIHLKVVDNIDEHLKTSNSFTEVFSISINGIRCKMIDPVVSIDNEQNIMEFKSYWSSDRDDNSSLRYVFDEHQDIFVEISLSYGELIVIISTY